MGLSRMTEVSGSTKGSASKGQEMGRKTGPDQCSTNRVYTKKRKGGSNNKIMVKILFPNYRPPRFLITTWPAQRASQGKKLLTAICCRQLEANGLKCSCPHHRDEHSVALRDKEK